MQVKYFAVVVLITAAFLSACSKGYESTKNVNDLVVTLKAESYPLVKSDNTIAIRVEDSAKKPVSDANVDVRYYMPPMPGMAPMDYSATAVKKGDVYYVTANIPMEGGWRFEVNTARPGSSAASAVFNLDAR